MNLAAKYRPSNMDDIVEQDMTVQILKSMCLDSEMKTRNFLFTGPAGTGKAQPLYSKVLTPTGFKTMSDIKVGDYVFTHTGAVAEVAGVFPQGFQPVFEICLSDNTSIRVAESHLNSIYIYDGNKYENKTVKTIQLYNLQNSGHKLFIGTPKIAFSDIQINISSYAIGMAIAMQNSGNKLCPHIPYDYLYNSNKVRIDLLRGILDVQSVLENGKLVFCTEFPEMSEEFAFLVRSLGIIDTISISTISATDFIRYKHSLSISDTSELITDEKENLNNDKNYRKIEAIKYIGYEQCKCIYVDHDDHTYISNGFIPTHNTTLARAVAEVINKHQGEPIEIDAASHSGVEAMSEIVSQAQTYPIGCKWKIFIIDECHAISSQGWQKLLRILEDNPAKTIFMFATTNPEKIPVTIISRLQVFNLSKISTEGIYNRLKAIIKAECNEENIIEYSDDAVRYIAKLADGGMRTAITMLEKVLSYTNNISSESVRTALGLPSYDDYFNLLNAYSRKDNAEIARIIDTAYNSGINFNKWIAGFHSFIINIVKYILLQDISKTIIPNYYKDKISNYTQAHSYVCLKLANKLIKLNQELKTTQYPQETALTYLCVTDKIK